MSDGGSDQHVLDIAELATEYWKLLRNYDRLVEAAPETLRQGLVAQAKYGARRLGAILDRAKLVLVTFEGQDYTPNLPMTAVNADDFAGERAVVDQTLEPAIVSGTTPIRIGRVFLRAPTQTER